MQYKFIDLFAGIGGFHLALHKLNQKCVFASELDKHARNTYELNFKKKSSYIFENKLFNQDILLQDYSKIPNFDILCGGFPCQPFSQAGYKRGFKDNKDGNLFFAILEILKKKKPTVFFLENVRHLKNHDNGKTFKIIYKSLQNLNYSFDYKIIKASDFGLPQHRPRVYMVGFYKPRLKNMFKELSFTFPKEIPLKKTMSDIFGKFVAKELNSNDERKVGFTLRVGGGKSPIQDRRNWDGYIVNNKIVRLKPKQGLQMMGFPKSFKLPVSDNQAMKQLGNSVAVNVVKEIGKEIKYHLKHYSK